MQFNAMITKTPDVSEKINFLLLLMRAAMDNLTSKSVALENADLVSIL